MLELELIGRKHVGGRHRALAQELRDSGAHINAAAGVADHRVAAITRRRIGGLDLGESLEDCLAGLRSAEIAGQHAVATCEHSALFDPAHEVSDRARLDHLAANAPVPGMVGEHRGVDRPDLASEPLQREHGGRIADVAIGNVRVDGEQIHGGGHD